MSSISTVFFDLDGTLTKRDTYLDFLFGYVLRHPKRLFHMLFLPFAVIVYKVGARDNTWLKVVFLKAVLGGQPREILEKWSEDYTEKLLKTGMRQGAIARLRAHQQEGDRLILVSASLDLYVVLLGEKLGFEDVICTRARWDKSKRLAGDLEGKNCYGSEKLVRIKKWLSENGNSENTVAYSDHHTDNLLLDWVKTAVAVNPTKKLAHLAATNNIEIVNW